MYEGSFSLGARCFSEFAATALMIFLGLGTLANELLAKTKGHGMGYVSQRASISCQSLKPFKLRSWPVCHYALRTSSSPGT